MKINSIRIENFRAIHLLQATELSNSVVIAGPNGCGKSSIFDAVRLLKSTYGQYNEGEQAAWFNEFQINLSHTSKQTDLKGMFNDTSKKIVIKMVFQLADSEKKYLFENASAIYKKMTRVITRNPGPPGMGITASIYPKSEAANKKELKFCSKLKKELENEFYTAEIKLALDGTYDLAPSEVIKTVFSTYNPENLGVIDFHSATRGYGRERINTLQLQLQNDSEQQGQFSLYNTQNKYGGIKSELLRLYISQLVFKDVSNETGSKFQDKNSLEETLIELFEVFFPGKKFIGARPSANGEFSFPIRLDNGREHDIDELSSGEKEILFGYLRLRNSSPKNSIILLDEPEAHLNPRIVSGLPRFYQKHLGEALGNQIWLITHSDALLRNAVDEPGYNVYHMQPPSAVEVGINQLEMIPPSDASDGIEHAIVNLVGDLATYSPRSKVVILEGEESEVDANIIRKLFPEFSERVNLISAGPKRRVGAIHELLDKASGGGRLSARFYSIVDRDFDGEERVEAERHFRWDVYHIENYLLVPEFLCQVLQSAQLGTKSMSEAEVKKSLKECAKSTIKSLVRIKLEAYVNQQLTRCVSPKFNPKLSLSIGSREAAERSSANMAEALNHELELSKLVELEEQLTAELSAALNNGEWVKKFRGRDILKLFVAKHKNDLNGNYEMIRNLIVNSMGRAGYKPDGMQYVINSIEK